MMRFTRQCKRRFQFLARGSSILVQYVLCHERASEGEWRAEPIHHENPPPARSSSLVIVEKVCVLLTPLASVPEQDPPHDGKVTTRRAAPSAHPRPWTFLPDCPRAPDRLHQCHG